ncbi:nicotinate-nucleotide pyrophosphorylase [Curvularia clavata]|uniref:Nicotinate-nucleotide pyrophosphorylase n=1 Tax=Curvularia clavata TaxID=95742 RepID=A0A9Q8YZI8_CURCL|nr:nicotinate-nucleotide pyrophosphorylase [Curvularia clavata]
MRSFNLSTVLATLSLPLLAAAETSLTTSNPQYTLTDNLTYDNFFSAFDFFSEPDPTHGFVRYQTLSSAISQQLIGYMPDTRSVYLGVDSTSKEADSTGRASVRLESKKSWNHGLLIADIRHMPASQCGVWPAFWLVSASKTWPEGGEIDILEGVNDDESSKITLHTSSGCTVDNSSVVTGNGSDGAITSPFSGTMLTSDCDVNAEGQSKNMGCSIQAPYQGGDAQLVAGNTDPELPSYGTSFNSVSGGVYAMEWTADDIAVWLFPRDSDGFNKFFPHTNETMKEPDPAAWGPPLARFGGKECDFEQRFKDLRVVFNTAFCGDWAGREWDKSCREKTGVETCEEYVRDHPEAFSEAYWDISGLWWWQKK